MKNNPFVTVLLLFATEFLLYQFIDYNELIFPSSKYWDLQLPFYCFFTPIIALIIAFSAKDLLYEKEFRKFSLILFVVSIIVFAFLLYGIALGRAFKN